MCGILTFQGATVKKKQTGYGALGLQFKTLRQEDYKFLSEEQSEVKASLSDPARLCLEIKSTKQAGNMA